MSEDRISRLKTGDEIRSNSVMLRWMQPSKVRNSGRKTKLELKLRKFCEQNLMEAKRLLHEYKSPVL